ncbi:hypothetical protein D9M69_437400 [compost metagenome]
MLPNAEVFVLFDNVAAIIPTRLADLHLCDPAVYLRCGQQVVIDGRDRAIGSGCCIGTHGNRDAGDDAGQEVSLCLFFFRCFVWSVIEQIGQQAARRAAQRTRAASLATCCRASAPDNGMQCCMSGTTLDEGAVMNELPDEASTLLLHIVDQHVLGELRRSTGNVSTCCRRQGCKHLASSATRCPDRRIVQALLECNEKRLVTFTLWFGQFPI